MIARNSVRFTAIAATLVFAAACDRSSPTSPNALQPQVNAAVTLPAGAIAGDVWVCKDAPSGQFDFTVSITAGTLLEAAPAIDAGNCTKVATPGGLSGNSVTVTEAAEAGYLFDHIDAYTIAAGTNVVTQEASPILSPTITRAFGDVGRIFVFVNTLEPTDNGCTLTQGYWKNHPTAWPVQSLTLGSVTYTKAQLISILKTPTAGNGLISLSYQLIAAKLNIAAGASVPAAVAQAISDADALIGGLVVPPVGSGYLAPASTSSLTTILDNYNNGLTGPGHCPD